MPTRNSQGNGVSNRKQKTYCRICEAHCGLEVEVDSAERIVQVRPNKEHVVSKGYACIKGTSVGHLHDDPDRINYPMKRVDGAWQRIGWDQALAEIGARVTALRSAHGDRCIGMYQGNPTYFSFQNMLYSSAFLEALNSPNIFASHSVDSNNKFEAATHIYGRSLVHPTVDLENVQFFMCFGSNPVVSQMSFIQVINPLAKLKAIEARGGKVVIVDPRRTETADKVGEHLPIKPGTDAYLLLAMLHVIAHENTLERATARQYGHGVDRFIDCAKDWTPERVAAITGIAADSIRRLALAFRDADGAALYMSTGVNMGPFGTLAYWLLQGLNFITGNIDRKGGLLVPQGAFDALRLASWLGLGGFDEHRTLTGGWHRVAGCFPVSALADEIQVDHPQRIRALFISAGNPVHSLPNGQVLATAMEKLELVVAIDIYPNATSAMADYLLPATDMLERADFPASHMALQEDPHAMYTPAVVAPLFERRQEWEIFSDLALACGARFSGGSLCNFLPHINRALSKIPGVSKRAIKPDHLLALLLRWGGQVSLKTLKQAPDGIALQRSVAGSFLGKRVPSDDKMLQLWPPKLAADLQRLESKSASFMDTADQLRLIGQRDRRSHNSWMHNNRHIQQPKGNRALIHPQDALRRQIADGDAIEIRTAQAAVVLLAKLTDEVCPGVIAVPHGWGHSGTGLTHAASLPGENINRIIPGGPEQMEPVSGQAIMLGHAVTVTRAQSPQA